MNSHAAEISTPSDLKSEVLLFQTERDWLEARAKDLTSTVISALFGCCPYVTEFELYHRIKQQEVIEVETTQQIKWGQRLQDAIAHGIAEDMAWNVHRMSEYMRIPELRIGSSFDFGIGGHPMTAEGGVSPVGLLEIKNVHGLAFHNQWIVDGDDIEAPPHIEIQVQVQLLVSGAAYAYIGALVGGNDVKLLHRDRDEEIFRAIIAKSRKFWLRVDSNTPPSPDYVKDAEFIARLYRQSCEGKVLHVDANSPVHALANLYREWQSQERVATEQKKALKAEILTYIQDAEKVVGDGFSISAKEIKSTLVETYERKGYRDFRVNWKKAKE